MTVFFIIIFFYQTPLHIAIDIWSLDIVTDFISNDKCDLNVKGKHDITPLLLAVMLGERQVVRALLQQDDIDVNCRDDRGRTAAHLAAGLRNSSIMQILHESGRFDLNAKDDKGDTPLDTANSKVSPEVITYLSEILNLGNDEEEDENDNDLENDNDNEKNGGKPVLLDNKFKIFYSPEEDEFEINDKIKFLNRLPIHGAIYKTSNQDEEGDDNNYSLNDTDDFLKAEKRSNELAPKHKLKAGKEQNDEEEDEIDEDDDEVENPEKPRRKIQFIDMETEEEEKTIDDLMNSYDPDDNDKFIKNDSAEFDGSNEFIVLNDPSDDKIVSSSNDLEPKIDSLVDQDVEGRQNVELLEAERLIAITADDDENSLEKTEDFIEDEDITNSIDGQQNKESNSNSNSNSQSQSTSFNVSQNESQSQSQSQEGENSYVQNDLPDQEHQADNDNLVADHFDINLDEEFSDNVDDNIDEAKNDEKKDDDKEITEKKDDEQQTDK